MQKLIIFGDLTSGYGGMETAIRAFYRLMSARYHVELIYIRAKNPKNNYDWLQGLTHTFPTSLFSARWLELNKAKRLLRQQINREAVAAVICYDRKSILLAQEVMKTSRNRVPIYS